MLNVIVAMRSFLVASELQSWDTPDLMIIDVKACQNSKDVIDLGDLEFAVGAAMVRVQV